MKLLVIGYGSIGKRHAKNACFLDHEVVLLRHLKGDENKEGFREYYSFDDMLKSDGYPDGAIVCSPTLNHLKDVRTLVEHNIPFLLEKPPTGSLSSTLTMKAIIDSKGFSKYDIAFNLRYHPTLNFLKNFLPVLGKVYSARIYVGYYLPYWRKGVDYRQTMSAKKELGGAVHKELVHEIDYLLWLLGLPEKITGYVNRVSRLEITTEDICSAIFVYEDGSIAELHLDYLSQKYLRGGQMIAENGTVEWDIKDGKVLYHEKNTEGFKEVSAISPEYDFNDTYLCELKNFVGIIDGEKKTAIDMMSAIDIMSVLEAIEESSAREKWINLKDMFN